LQQYRRCNPEETFFGLSLPLDYPGGEQDKRERIHRILGRVCATEAVNFNYVYAERDHFPKTFVRRIWRILVTCSTQPIGDGLCHVGALFDVNADGGADSVYLYGYKANVDVVRDRSTE